MELNSQHFSDRPAAGPSQNGGGVPRPQRSLGLWFLLDAGPPRTFPVRCAELSPPTLALAISERRPLFCRRWGAATGSVGRLFKVASPFDQGRLIQLSSQSVLPLAQTQESFRPVYV